MPRNTKKDIRLADLFLTKVMVMYDIETSLVKALPKLAKAASDSDLKKGFEDHLEETKTHVERIEKVFDLLGEDPKKLKSGGIRGIIEDGEWVIKNIKSPESRDSNLVRAAQYAEHYEISGYTGAIAWARALGKDDIVGLLEQNLNDEIAANETLEESGVILDRLII